MMDTEAFFPQPEKEYTELTRKIRDSYRRRAYENLELSGSGNGTRRVRERMLLDAIAMGNEQLLNRVLKEMNQPSGGMPVGNLSQNDLQQARYVLTAGVTLFCRVALDRGVSENLAYTISDTFIQYGDRSQNSDEIYYLFLQAAREFCGAVQESSFGQMRRELRSCCEYISCHLHEKILLKDLSRVSFLTENYISRLFVEQFGLRPIAYIRREKINYAAFLLRNTEEPISAISAVLAFPSPGAFAVQFRQQMGMPPRQYRMQTEEPQTKFLGTHSGRTVI